MSIHGTFRQKGWSITNGAQTQVNLNAQAATYPNFPETQPIIEAQIVEKIVEVVKEVPTYVDREVIKYVDVVHEIPVEVVREVVTYVTKEVPVEVVKELVQYVDREVPVFIDRIVTRMKTHEYVWIALGIETLVLCAILAHKFL